jgi:hypothetical protein
VARRRKSQLEHNVRSPPTPAIPYRLLAAPPPALEPEAERADTETTTYTALR